GAIGLSAVVGGLVYVSRPVQLVPAVPAIRQARPEAPVILPPDLALVPQNASALATVRLAELVEQEGVKRFLRRLARYEQASAAHWEADFAKAFCFPPSDIERITIVMLPAPAGQSSVSVEIVRTRLPFGKETIVGWLGAKSREESCHGKKYYVAPSPRETVACLFTEQILLVTSSASALDTFLAGNAGTDATPGLRDSLDLAERQYQGAVAVGP